MLTTCLLINVAAFVIRVTISHVCFVREPTLVAAFVPLLPADLPLDFGAEFPRMLKKHTP